MVAGMTDDQWREFGSTLQAVHSSGLAEEFRGQLPVETFALPSAALARRVLELTHSTEFENPVAAQFAAFWREHAERIQQMLARAEELGRLLQSRSFDHVLCHADIHAANILVHEDGRISLIDWDGPLIAPRERDLLFVVGSRIARTVEPKEEALFFAGYGPVDIDPEALIYYRYERIVEDLGRDRTECAARSEPERPDACRGVPAGDKLLRAGRRYRPRRGGHPAESLEWVDVEMLHSPPVVAGSAGNRRTADGGIGIFQNPVATHVVPLEDASRARLASGQR